MSGTFWNLAPAGLMLIQAALSDLLFLCSQVVTALPHFFLQGLAADLVEGVQLSAVIALLTSSATGAYFLNEIKR